MKFLSLRFEVFKVTYLEWTRTERGGGGEVILAPLLSAENRNTDHNPCYVVGNPLAVFKVGGGFLIDRMNNVFIFIFTPDGVWFIFCFTGWSGMNFLPVESSRSASIVGCENDHRVIKHSIPFKSFRYVSNGLVQWSYHPSIRPSVVHYNILEFL